MTCQIGLTSLLNYLQKIRKILMKPCIMKRTAASTVFIGHSYDWVNSVLLLLKLSNSSGLKKVFLVCIPFTRNRKRRLLLINELTCRPVPIMQCVLCHVVLRVYTVCVTGYTFLWRSAKDTLLSARVCVANWISPKKDSNYANCCIARFG